MRFRTTIDVLVEYVDDNPPETALAATFAPKYPSTRHRYEVMGHRVDERLAADWIRGVLGPRQADTDPAKAGT